MDRIECISIEYNGLIFNIGLEDHALLNLCKKDHEAEISEIFIPHELPSGDRIDFLDEYVIQDDHFNKVTVDEGINLRPYAFSWADIDEVVLPLTCEIIPEYCFLDSKVKRVSGVDNVAIIEKSAFMRSKIQSFRWPDSCSVIPSYCFYTSCLSIITNLEHVTCVCESAFAFSNPLLEADFSNCICSIGSCSFKGLYCNNIALPYYISDTEAFNAFHSKKRGVV